MEKLKQCHSQSFFCIETLKNEFYMKGGFCGNYYLMVFCNYYELKGPSGVDESTCVFSIEFTIVANLFRFFETT